MIDLVAHVAPHSGIWWPQGAAEPVPLVDALLDQLPRIGEASVFVGLSWNDRLTRGEHEGLTVRSYGALGGLRALSAAGRLDVLPVNYSALPRLFAEGVLPHDVGFVQVAPAAADGTHSLGLGVDYAADAIATTRVLIAEVNAAMPDVPSAPRIPGDRFAARIATDRPLLTAPPAAPDEVDRRIAQHVAGLVDDGDTIQLGVGGLPEAVLAALGGHRDLGVHSGMISDGVLRLIDAGVVTGARKEIDTGRVVAGTALGGEELYRRIPALPIELRAASYTHAPAVLGRLRRLVAVNSAVEVDLLGQVNAETRNGAYVGAVGGHADFSHAAATSGARSVIALRATSRGNSTIVPTVERVTTTRSDVDAVVTEHGVAWLRGADEQERARRLIGIAAPEFRDQLARADSAAPSTAVA